MGLSVWHLLIVLAIALVIFGTKKIRDLGGDLGGAIRNFKQAVKEGEDEETQEPPKNVAQLDDKSQRAKPERVIEGKATTTRPRKKKG
jgi:sec-independent protein translocase protein TatA